MQPVKRGLFGLAPPWVRGRVSICWLGVILAVALVGSIWVNSTGARVPYEAREQQLEAARLMQKALEEIRALRFQKGLPISKELDPNETGLIGEEFTELTTTLGDLLAKRTATNPDFAALMVRYYHGAGLVSGNVIAIGASGSFPALILASLCAARAMDLKPIIIYSLGASMYGATIPELTFIDILAHLNRSGLLPYDLAAVSMGGDNDQGDGTFFESSKDRMRTLGRQSGAIFIDEPDLPSSSRMREQIYDALAGDEPVRCFVNIGGASPNYGTHPASNRFPNGLVLRGPVPPEDPERGLIFEYSSRGVPVIHMINVKGLALKAGIPIDPVPLPQPGVSPVYEDTSHSRIAMMFVLVVIAVLAGLGRTGFIANIFRNLP